MSRLVFFPNKWESGNIRGRQVADAVGGVVNPCAVYKDDVCIFVKTVPSDRLLKHVRRVYIDVVDNIGVFDWLDKHPTAGIIAMGITAAKMLSERFPNHDVVTIPEHHCNFERETIPDVPPRTVGYIGASECIHLSLESLRNAFRKAGLDFIWSHMFVKRRQACDFYKQTQIQISYRVDGLAHRDYMRLKCPLKVFNAASFGIPMVAYPEVSFVDEADGYFLPAYHPEQLIEGVLELVNNPDKYRALAEKGRLAAENYHIDKIAPLYKQLLDR